MGIVFMTQVVMVQLCPSSLWAKGSRADFTNSEKVDVFTPTVTLSRSALTLLYCSGSASPAGTFTLAGSNMQSDVTLTATSGFELSTDYVTYASSVTVSPTGGSIASTPIYVRIAASAASLPSGSITVSTTNAANQNISLSAENNRGLHFDGINDHITIPDNNAHDITGNLTMEAWLNPVSTGKSQVVIGKIEHSSPFGSAMCYSLRINSNGTAVVQVGNGSSIAQLTSVSSIVTGNWVHVAVTFESSTRLLRLYFDGVEVLNTTAVFSTLRTTTFPMLIGSYDGGLSGLSARRQYYKGEMDEVRIWNVTRTPQQLRAFAERRLQGDELGLVAYYPLNNGSGATATDKSPTLINGTLKNFALSGSTSNWIDVCGSIVSLPVELLHFRANGAASGVQLDWATAMEQDNAGFQVERSANGRDFEAIGWVAGAGTTLATSHYTFTDDAPLAGVSYYRLEQRDYDGAVAYSPLASVSRKGAPSAFDESQIQIYPNPADAHLTIDLPLTGVESIAIRNVLGQVLYTEHSPQGTQTLDIRQWERGLYFLEVTAGQERFGFRFVVK